MLGWHVSVYRQKDGGGSPATFESPEGARLAVWQTDWDGLKWLDELAKAGKAVDLGGNGYPCRYTAIAENLVPVITAHIPKAREYWQCDAGDLITSKWEGKTVVDSAAIQCPKDEWLIVEAWDES
jgi:hypothetical protein